MQKEDYDTWYDNNYWNVRICFEEHLLDLWYPRFGISEVNDWREEYCQEWYKIYLEDML